eukprot:gene9150-9318_t
MGSGACAMTALAVDPAMLSHFRMLAAALESIETRSGSLATKLATAEAQVAVYKERLAEAEETVARMEEDLEECSNDQEAHKHEVSRLSVLLEAARMQAAFNSEQLMADLADERSRADRLRDVRDEALLQRDDALLELANAYADIDAMQATLADSALYVRQLRRRVSELEVWQQQQHAAPKQLPVSVADRHRDQDQQGVFSLASIKASIQAAVAAAAQQPEAERKKQIRQLQLRWHPGRGAADKSQAATQQLHFTESRRLLQQRQQVAPVITPLAAPLQAESGSRTALPAITDPNGDPISVSWKLVSQDQKTLRTGVGGVVTLPDVPPGQYTILVTADDGQLQSEGRYTLIVRQPGTQPTPNTEAPLVKTSTTNATAAAAAAPGAGGPAKPPVLPIVKGPLQGSVGGSITIPAVSSPTGGQTDLSWNLVDPGSRQRVASGRGSTVPLAEVAAGGLTGKTGGRVNLPPITDPEGNGVSVSWKIRRSGKGIIRTGVGGVVTLASVPAGGYTVVVTATDSSKASSTRIYQMKVTS